MCSFTITAEYCDCSLVKFVKYGFFIIICGSRKGRQGLSEIGAKGHDPGRGQRACCIISTSVGGVETLNRPDS